MSSVAIIGSGITGLIAAWRLKQSGVPVTVYEASRRAGGVIRSLRRDGFLAEYGPNTLLETSPKITQLVSDLGLARRRLDPDPAAKNRYVVRGGKPVALPASPVSFFLSSLFSASAKLRLLKEPFIGRADHEESVGEFVQRRLGQEFLDYAIDPMVSGIYAGDPGRLSVRHAFPKIHALETRYGSLIKGQFLGASERKKRGEVSKATAPKFSFDEGLQVLTDTLAEKLGESLRLNTTVQCISQAGGDRWDVATECNGHHEQARHTAILYAGTAHQLARLEVRADDAPDLGLFGEIQYPPVASIVLGFKRSEVAHPLDGFGVLVPRIEGFQILGTIFSSSLFPNRAPKDCVTLTTYAGGARNPGLASRSEEDLVEIAHQDLKRLFGVSGRPVFRQVAVFKRAIPQYNVGFGTFKQRMDELEAALPGVFLAGHFRNGVSLSDSILAGTEAAEKIETFVRAGEVKPDLSILAPEAKKSRRLLV